MLLQLLLSSNIEDYTTLFHMNTAADIALAALIVTILVLLVQIAFRAGEQSNRINSLEVWRVEFTSTFNGAMGQIRGDLDHKMERLENLFNRQ